MSLSSLPASAVSGRSVMPDLGLSVADVAERLGISWQTLQGVLRETSRGHGLRMQQARDLWLVLRAPTADALKEWISRNGKDWHEQPIAELQHRDAIREQALGAAYATDHLDVPAKSSWSGFWPC
jgi:hypothetical protein